MLELALWLKRNGFRLDQVQTFLPTPLALATAMYHSERNPLRKVTAFLRWHDPENWPLLREALIEMGRAELIGNGPHCLVPRQQPARLVAAKAGGGRKLGVCAAEAKRR
jgi:hypothetical protein